MNVRHGGRELSSVPSFTWGGCGLGTGGMPPEAAGLGWSMRVSRAVGAAYSSVQGRPLVAPNNPSFPYRRLTRRGLCTAGAAQVTTVGG